MLITRKIGVAYKTNYPNLVMRLLIRGRNLLRYGSRELKITIFAGVNIDASYFGLKKD